jgi:hypothetical protein
MPTRALSRRYKLVPKQNVKIIALGGGTNHIAAMETGAVDAALIEAPYNVMLERKGFRKILFVGDLIPSPLAGFGTRMEKIQKQPDEIQRLMRAANRHGRNSRRAQARYSARSRQGVRLQIRLEIAGMTAIPNAAEPQPKGKSKNPQRHGVRGVVIFKLSPSVSSAVKIDSNAETVYESCCFIFCSNSLTEDLAITRSNWAR